MSDIRVSLTSTGYLKEYGGGEHSETLIWKNNIPVCVAEFGMMMFGGDREWFEHTLAQSMLRMAKVIQIDVDSKSLFIGEDPHKEDTGLVVYRECNSSNEYAKEFFRRWSEVESLVMQLHVFGAGHEVMFSIVGLWVKGAWHHLDIKSKGSIFIVGDGPHG